MLDYFEAIEVAKRFDAKPEILLLGMQEPYNFGVPGAVHSNRIRPIVNIFHPKRDEFVSALGEVARAANEFDSVWPSYILPRFNSNVNAKNIVDTLKPYNVRFVEFKYQRPIILILPDDTVLLYNANSGLFTALGFAINHGMDVIEVLKNVAKEKGVLK